MRFYRIALRGLILWLGFFASVAFAAPNDVGIILMHGKWDERPFHTNSLASALEKAGYRVVQPTMTWGGARKYDVDYQKTLMEIDAEAEKLRAAGAKYILVGGMSFGANGAFAYAGAGHKVDGVIAIAPGHIPDAKGWIKKFGKAYQKARKMVDAGKGEDKASFEDPNSGGRSQSISMRAKVYASFFDPKGLASMEKSASSFPQPLPVLVVIGKKDPGIRYANNLLLPAILTHPKNSVVEVNAGHLDAISEGLQATVQWVNDLGY
ncbi:alpha/beta hydrolase [Sedimenticola selenatireducens]|uniref:Alpha/beta hydrolase n=1 Tax=Sedimenticola selenatireducens TaxID=191960 RepID=A0A557SK05_9GAMM|nr:alpha/beta hydrolase [Sedimenticola selenatireducens]TVO77749.1 alpha/beta hydrolase [Sedimenticola selenatireducens]TVT65054.1 MAG: alpha/beta hydrolase [Sedimenticola selenatireducens]